MKNLNPIYIIFEARGTIAKQGRDLMRAAKKYKFNFSPDTRDEVRGIGAGVGALTGGIGLPLGAASLLPSGPVPHWAYPAITAGTIGTAGVGGIAGTVPGMLSADAAMTGIEKAVTAAKRSSMTSKGRGLRLADLKRRARELAGKTGGDAKEEYRKLLRIAKKNGKKIAVSN